ncbi:MAG: DUF899 family protein [Nocardioidaceae bacterium]
MGWTFPWVSSLGSDFNDDFHATWTPPSSHRSSTTGRWSRQRRGRRLA